MRILPSSAPVAFRASFTLRGEPKVIYISFSLDAKSREETSEPGAARGEGWRLKRQQRPLLTSFLFAIGRLFPMRIGRSYAPWHFLYFFPLPQGQGSLRPTFSCWRWTVRGAAGASPRLRVRRGDAAGRATGGGSSPRTAWTRNSRSSASDLIRDIMAANMSKPSRLYSISGSFCP